MSSDSRDNRPPEMPAVRTTIVGGRPPGPGTPVGPIPYGMEILVKKAAVDPEFKSLLLTKRARAAAEIEGLVLEPAEAAMLDGVPAAQLEAIIAAIRVPEETRRALLGKVTLAALVALGIVVLVKSCATSLLQSRGISPDSAGLRAVDDPSDDPRESAQPSSVPASQPGEGHSRGIRPDRPDHRATE